MRLRDITLGTIGGSILISLVLILGVSTAYEELTMTAEQREARARIAASRPKTPQELSRGLDISFCHEIDRCSKYGRARQECATAGDFKNCVAVKLNGDTNALSVTCNDDGSLSPTITISPPGPLRCLALRLLP